MTYLGMQIMVEGLALAAFGFMHQLTDRAAAQAAAALRDERRGSPRRLRRAVAARSTTRSSTRPRSRSARSSPSRRPCACATASCSRRCGSAWASPVKEVVPLVLSDPSSRCSSRCCSPRSCRTARSSACSTRATTAWLRQKFEELGVIQFEDWVDTGEEYDVALSSTKARSWPDSVPGPAGLATCSDIPVPDEDRPFIDRVLASAGCAARVDGVGRPVRRLVALRRGVDPVDLGLHRRATPRSSTGSRRWTRPPICGIRHRSCVGTATSPT